MLDPRIRATLFEMRVGIFVVSASLAGAGVAFAQSDWVVDPWSPAFRTMPVSSERASHTALRSRTQAPVEWIDERSPELADPWQGSTIARGTPAAQAQSGSARTSGESGEWAKPIPLVVDPWEQAPAKSSVPAPELIVDPWADPGRL